MESLSARRQFERYENPRARRGPEVWEHLGDLRVPALNRGTRLLNRESDAAA